MRSNFGKLLIDEALRGFCVKMLRASEDPSTKPGRDCLHTRHGWIEAVAELIVCGKNHPLAAFRRGVSRRKRDSHIICSRTKRTNRAAKIRQQHGRASVPIKECEMA